MSDKKIINDLTEQQMNKVETIFEDIKDGITQERYSDTIRYSEWINEKVDLNLQAKQYAKTKQEDDKHLHPLRPRRGDVYLAKMGQNIGAEINEQHLVLILQNNKGNLYSDTVVVIPISSSGQLFLTHEKITEVDIKTGRLDKLPSKAKTEQIHYMDKARLVHKVATLEEECIKRICKRLKKNLCL